MRTPGRRDDEPWGMHTAARPTVRFTIGQLWRRHRERRLAIRSQQVTVRERWAYWRARRRARRPFPRTTGPGATRFGQPG